MGVACRFCGSPARTNPCWQPAKTGLCKGASEAWVEKLAAESAEADRVYVEGWEMYRKAVHNSDERVRQAIERQRIRRRRWFRAAEIMIWVAAFVALPVAALLGVFG